VKISGSNPGNAAGHLVVLASCSAAPDSILQPAPFIASAAVLPGALNTDCAEAACAEITMAAAKVPKDRT
jgi:hypothetical protein